MDEIGDTSLRTQAKILRVLEQGSFKRVGGRQNVQVDVRIVSATNQDLANLILEGCFREDLLYRLNTIPIKLPPLRERGHDIFLLLDYFLKKYMKQKEPRVKFSSESLEILESYSWPGNVRELRSVVDYAVTMTPSTFITPDHLPSFLFSAKAHDIKENRSPSSIIPDLKENNLPAVIKKVERNLIKNVLAESENKSKAIRLLGISRRTFYKKLKEYDLD
jgi:transcriptional regulator with PAS, ATPase and Fis domain